MIMANYGYCRCSTNDTKQDVQRQVKDVISMGADADLIYTEYQSGTKRDRIELNRMLEAIGENDTLYVTEISRISRSMRDLLEILDKLKDKKVKVVLGSFVLDFTKGSVDPMVMGMVNMMGVFSQMEREITVNRIKSGQANARAKGKHLGRSKTTIDDVPNLFKKYYPEYVAKEITVAELTRLSGLKSRTSTYKYIKILQEAESGK